MSICIVSGEGLPESNKSLERAYEYLPRVYHSLSSICLLSLLRILDKGVRVLTRIYGVFSG